ncbi:MAG: hypothetical protein BWY95_01335 [Bacteroidetes bacterium ADurb.BinA104]|nr:MAG: hypothetical protein BWY95_01335 [Bacteroidetes bacterium ADurb.BinA104]
MQQSAGLYILFPAFPVILIGVDKTGGVARLAEIGTDGVGAHYKLLRIGFQIKRIVACFGTLFVVRGDLSALIHYAVISISAVKYLFEAIFQHIID